ncbi:hypothetical protein BE221DRAFT_193518 [Ostreococcus tauri]|uniref:Uncharacterized protein n=1 Tax=Ostreococcus tauri TaxID=70448 RepID=A0A1Y5I5S2_OSTTA|nr:hypothetical protein BE221DRAFT_193518 [Ostreococcus tauri]
MTKPMRARGAIFIALALAFALGARAQCEYYTNCAACVANTACGWCGHDPNGQGGTLIGGHGRFTVASGVVTGVNTRFTRTFRGETSGAKFDVPGDASYDVDYVTSDTSLQLATNPTDVTDQSAFGIAARDGTGSIKASTATTARPNSATTETLTITGTGTKFTKELKVGYWLIWYDASSVVHYRVVTAIASDTSLTVDYSLAPISTTISAFANSGGGFSTWGFVSCPPRIGKRNVGLGTIETYKDQSQAVGSLTQPALNTRTASATIYADTGDLVDASGSATGMTHIIHGRGTRFASQLGASTTWDAKFYKSGPWLSVQINGDWETVGVKEIGTDASSPTRDYSQYLALLKNSFSEPLLKATHWEWYPMLTKGYGTIRSYGKRVVSNNWDNKEGFVDIQGTTADTAGSLSSQGVYGDTRFLTQLRTGYTITACGQTRMVNSIQSDVELTIDRPFTLGNREFVAASGSSTTLTDLYVRGLTRLLPLWPRGVTARVIIDNSGADFKYTTYWKTFANDVASATLSTSAWTELQDSGVSQGIGVYIKFKSGVTFTDGDEWRLHVADIENCRYYVSTEGERYIADDNLNPPICYNHGKCVAANSADSNRPAVTLSGTMNVVYSTGTLTGTSGTKFNSELSVGDIIWDGNSGTSEARVTAILSDTSATLETHSSAPADISSSTTIKVLKCAGGIYGSHTLGGTVERSVVPQAYLPHPLHSFYQTWSHKYCEIDPGCCGFRVSSVVDPQQYAYYYLKPDNGDYNFRIAVHTVNDNLDLYATVGTTRPTTASYGHTSVRESVPWAIDVDESLVTGGGLDRAVLGGDTAGGLYSTALGSYVHTDDSPDCDTILVGVMGDNRYPQTVGASEYSARFYLEFNFPTFACDDSAVARTAWGNNFSYNVLCHTHGLRFAGDAHVVENEEASPKHVAYARTNGAAGGSPWKSSDDFRTSQRVGAVWWYRKVHIWDGFETNFEFQITAPTQCGGSDQICDGADGFAFVITNDNRQENVTSVHANTGWAGTKYQLCGASDNNDPTHADAGHGFVGCPGDGLGYGESTIVDSAGYSGSAAQCVNGLKKSLAVEFDTFYNQGKQHWWINATEYVSYNDNHVGVFMSTSPTYANQPDDLEGMHFGSTPSVPTLADALTHTVKIRYTRGFTTEKGGTGQITTTDVSASDRRKLAGTSTKFKTELRTGFEFGYGGRVKANVKVKINRDQTETTPQAVVTGTSGFPDDGEMCRVVSIAHLENTGTANATLNEVQTFMDMQQPAFNPAQASAVDYNIIKEFPGEIQVAVEDRDMAKILDTDGNAYIGFARVGYQAVEVHETHDIKAWSFCHAPGCVPY